MSNDTILLVDCNNLLYRSLYSTGQLTHKGVATGTAFGFFRDVVGLMDLHNTYQIVFCFDYGESFRKNVRPSYKEKRALKREKWTPEEKSAMKEFFRQCRDIRDDYLPYMGFQNICYKDNFEADDLIAAFCKMLQPNDEVVIVSSDEDMYQLLSHNIRIWNPRKGKTLNRTWFLEEYGVDPDDWVKVKAIAGCETDDIEGVKGVGEILACKYLQGNLKQESKAYQAIVSNEILWKDNIRLVELPWPGTPAWVLQEDKVTEKRWKVICDELGMKSLRSSAPVSYRNRR